MPGKSRNLGQFWQELKRRRVIHVITVYATAAFVIIELVGNLAEPLNLPASLPTIVIIVLAIGFPLAIILSWLYDLTSAGVERTRPLSKIKEEDKPVVPNAWKIATYVSFAVIIGLVVLNVMGGGKQLRAGDIQSLVVLPFENYTGDTELEYFVSGMHSSLIGDIGQLSGLRVISETSSKVFKDVDKSVPEIASELNVEAVVEASVMCLGENICLQVKLISTSPEEKQLWIADYEEDKSQILNLYNQITKEIAEEVKVKLTPREEKNLTRVQQHNPDLIELIYKGKFYMEQLTPEGFKTGQKYFNDAIAIDPSDPLPYLELAVAYSTASHVSAVVPDAQDRSIAYAHQALALDSSLADAYLVLASRPLYTDYDFSAGERYLTRAIDLNPNLSMAHYHYGWFLMLGNNVDEAIAEFKKSIEIDPIDVYLTCNLAAFYMWIGRYEEALAEGQKVLEMNPNYPYGLYVLGSAYTGLGRYEEAIEAHKKGLAISPGFENGLAVAYALSGQRDKALEIAIELEQYNSTWYTWALAEIYAVLGDHDKAIYWIEEAYNGRQDFVPWFKDNVLFKPLYDDPRFKEINQRLKLPG
jgi:TolB-like protein/Tfp pilus assembly protein PilF